MTPNTGNSLELKFLTIRSKVTQLVSRSYHYDAFGLLLYPRQSQMVVNTKIWTFSLFNSVNLDYNWCRIVRFQRKMKYVCLIFQNQNIHFCSHPATTRRNPGQQSARRKCSHAIVNFAKYVLGATLWHLRIAFKIAINKRYITTSKL